MKLEQLKAMVSAAKFDDLESSFPQAAEEGLAVADLASVLEATVAGGKPELAETLAWTLITGRCETLPPKEALDHVKALLPAVPTSTEIRRQTAELYRKVYASHPQLEALLKASGLQGTQSPRRAIRTLDICLAVVSGAYLANRYDGHVLLAKTFNDLMGEFELSDTSGGTVRVEPKNLADEYEIADENDFRVMCQHKPDELSKRLDGDSAAILVGICMVHGGQIDSLALKDMLVPRHIPADKWSRWWSRARTAAKRCKNLNLEGRNPVTIVYHSGGLSLEAELAPAVVAARTPLEKLTLLQQYLREAKDRKLTINAEFTTPIVQALAQQASSFQLNRPADALAAAISIDFLSNLGIARPETNYPSAKDIIVSVAKAADAVAELAQTPLWHWGLDALTSRADLADQLEMLLRLVPAGYIDDVASRLVEAGRNEAIEKWTAKATSQPIEYVDMYIWIWRGPAVPPANMPGKVELLSRMLKAMIELEHDWNVPAAVRKSATQRLRAALSASDYASYRQAVTQMDEAVAGTIKRLIERTGGLSHTVHENMMSILRENFYSLFVKAKVAAWLDENVIWTTESAMLRREAELKDLTEVKMLANAKAIGAAAEHGDLSENSEWKFALEERDLLRARAAKIQDELAQAQVIRPDDISTDAVGIGSKVIFKRLQDSAEIEMSFLGPWDSDLENNIYSYKTPLGQDLMGRRVGDEVTLKIDNKEEVYRIERLAAAI
jgi:transcription elongation GreA/GreB family factor